LLALQFGGNGEELMAVVFEVESHGAECCAEPLSVVNKDARFVFVEGFLCSLCSG
jgi:hypothetical protein